MSEPQHASNSRLRSRWFALGAASVLVLASGAGLAFAAEGGDEDPGTTSTIEAEAPEAPATPEVPDAPEAPEVPAAPEVPDAPEAAEAPEPQEAEEAPEVEDEAPVARSADGCPGGVAYESHGAYVTEVAEQGGDVAAAARSNCGMPVTAVEGKARGQAAAAKAKGKGGRPDHAGPPPGLGPDTDD